MRPTERVAKAIVDATLLAQEPFSETKHKKLEVEEHGPPVKRLKNEDLLEKKNKVKLENEDGNCSESQSEAKCTEDTLQGAEPKINNDKNEPEIKTQEWAGNLQNKNESSLQSY